MPEIKRVSLSKLRENPDNVRQLFGNLTELSKSIGEHGILQRPVARETENGLELVFGHRRFRAAKMAGLKEIEVEVREYTRQQAMEAMVAENAHREDVNPVELADAFAKMREEFKLSGEEIAERVKLPRTQVYDLLSLHDNLFAPAKKALLSERLGLISGIALSRVRGERMQDAALTEVLKLAKKEGEQPPARAVKKLIQDKYLPTSRQGLTKRAREQREHGAEVALRRRVVQRLLVRVAELVERKHHLDETDLRTMAVATAEASPSQDATREVFERRGLGSTKLGKVGATQLRSLVVELALAPFVVLDADGAYSAGARVVAKAYGLSLAELEKSLEAQDKAEALFKL